MSGEVIVDALPYIDLGYDEPGVKQAVNKIFFFSFKYDFFRFLVF